MHTQTSLKAHIGKEVYLFLPYEYPDVIKQVKLTIDLSSYKASEICLTTVELRTAARNYCKEIMDKLNNCTDIGARVAAVNHFLTLKNPEIFFIKSCLNGLIAASGRF
jgi:hypothetical protein